MTTKVTPSVATGGFFRKNALINGDFNIWQRGTSFTSIATATYHADRWFYSKSGAMVHDVSRSTDVPTVAEAGRLFNYSLLVDCTTVDASIAAGDYVVISQCIEGYNFLPLAQRAMVLSFWVKATKTGTYCVAVKNSGVDRTYVAEYTVSAADTWEKKTIAISASPSAGTWDYTNGIGLRINFTLACGATYQTAAGSWQTADFNGTTNQVNACDSTSNNFRITGVQLEAGSVATDFEQRLFADELALCQRYYTKTFPYSVAPVQNGAALGAVASDVAYAATAACVVCWPLPVEMRTEPTITTYNPFAANANWRNSGNTYDATWSAVSITNKAVYGQAGGASVTAGSTHLIHLTATAEL